MRKNPYSMEENEQEVYRNPYAEDPAWEEQSNRLKEYHEREYNFRRRIITAIICGLGLTALILWFTYGSPSEAIANRSRSTETSIDSNHSSGQSRTSAFSAGEVFTITPGETVSIQATGSSKHLRFMGYQGANSDGSYVVAFSLPRTYTTETAKESSFVVKSGSKITFDNSSFEVLNVDSENNMLTLQVK